MDTGNRKCLICGKAYSYCPNCGKDDKGETWRYLYDDVTCKKIFGVLSDYAFKHINKESAKNKLLSLKISEKSLTPDFKKQVDEIMKSDEPAPVQNTEPAQPLRKSFENHFQNSKKH